MRIHASDGTLIDNAFVTGLGAVGNQTIPLEFGPGSWPWGNDLYSVNFNTDELVRIDSAGNVTVIGTGFSNWAADIKFGADGAMYVLARDEDRIMRIVSAIPAVSEWGLVATSLLVLIAGTVVLGRRRLTMAR